MNPTDYRRAAEEALTLLARGVDLTEEKCAELVVLCVPSDAPLARDLRKAAHDAAAVLSQFGIHGSVSAVLFEGKQVLATLQGRELYEDSIRERALSVGATECPKGHLPVLHADGHGIDEDLWWLRMPDGVVATVR